jgi:hypothetical protein
MSSLLSRLDTQQGKENIMYEFRITNLATGKESIVFGYSIDNAYKRAKLNPAEWVVYSREYVD